MLSETDRQIVREFQRRLAAIVPVLDLRVFGSRARGDAAPDSDLDVFIELEESPLSYANASVKLPGKWASRGTA
jgi:predicted nucleotidyltransferase